MKIARLFLQGLVLSFSLLVSMVSAEDIDIFTGNNRIDFDLPSVIFILDNTSNWSRQSQQWPGGLVQGQSEVRAIGLALEAQIGKLNVGIMEYATQGSSSQNDGAYVRFDLQRLTADSKDELDTILTTIFNDINGSDEKRSSSNPYGYLPYDLYNYLAGTFQSKGGAGTPTNLADTAAYSSQFNEFDSPLNLFDACGDVYLIFVGNNANGSIASDDGTNTAALKALYEDLGEDPPDALYGDNGVPLAMPEFVTTTTTVPGEVQGNSASCWKESEVSSCTSEENVSGGLCVDLENCSCTVKASNQSGCQSTGKPSNRTYRWVVETGGGTSTVVEASGQFDTTGGLNYNFDDWTKFLHNYGVPLNLGLFEDLDDEFVDYVDALIPDRINVTTYTIDVFNKQQQADLSELWYSAADAGGGRYFQAKSEDQILAAINTALSDILSVSSSFAAVSMPLSATNRARVDNQVYIGMFRPAQRSEPRWYGNLKRYQLALFDGTPKLADINLYEAINPLSGFAGECAESYWSSDNDNYWEDLGVTPAPRSECPDQTTDRWSDLPDGPFVEKGGVAQQIRELEAGSDRTLYTVSDAEAIRALAVSDATAMGGTSVWDYLKGDIQGVNETMADAGLRPSVHGDVVHSRPLSIRYSDSRVVLYYGSNGGTFRAIDPVTGAESWALVAPEHLDKLERLYNDSPLIEYTDASQLADETYAPKDYFFDGPTGSIVNYDSNGDASLAYIYLSMRRGGRMIYALDVTDPDTAPSLLWRKGCPNVDDDSGCDTGFEDIGQTWSMPVGGYVEGYTDDAGDPKLVTVFGGGFDDCLNADQSNYPSDCSSADGKGVYIVDAVTGELLQYLATEAPVVAELSLVDIDFNGHFDFAYAADAAGGIYRVNFATLDDENPENNVTSLASGDWTINKIGEMSDTVRRFMTPPTAASFQGLVIVTIGSGDRERPLISNYPYEDQVQNRFYALIDKPHLTFVADPGGTLEDDEATTVDLDGSDMLVVAADLDDSSLTGKKGWYLNLPDRGEQVVNPSVIAGGKVFFNTFRPGGVDLGICRRPLGVGTGYQIPVFSPDYSEGQEIATPGIPIPPVIATVRIPPGLVYCTGDECPQTPADPCATGHCEVRTLCIGCMGFEPVEIEPVAPPIRQRVYFSEDIDRLE